MDATIKVEPKSNYVREIMGELRKAEGQNRQLKVDNTQLQLDVKRMKRTITSQAGEIARLRLQIAV